MSDQRPAPGAPIGAGFLYAAVSRMAAVRREEVPALAWAWLYIFAVLSSYYIMRPIREQMAVAGGVHNIQRRRLSACCC
jgi:AAA family ATP:ADP antiporter